MTPKEKAIELVEKIGNIKLYIDIEPRNIEGNIKYFDKDLVKECALIAVDETQQLIKNLSSCKNRFIYIVDEMNYWEEVKQEIEKL